MGADGAIVAVFGGYVGLARDRRYPLYHGPPVEARNE